MDKHSILLVDNETKLAETGEMILKQHDYKVTLLEKNTEALKLFENDPEAFDLVITNYNMPEMLGDEFTRKIKKIKDNIPVILSTKISEVNMNSLLSCRFDGLIFKPYRSDEIISMLIKLLGKNKDC